MVITLAGLQRAREVGGTHATRLMAAMTSAFAVGQILGPLAATYAFAFHGGFSIVLCGAAAMLLLSACALARGRKHEAPCGATI